MKASPYIYSFWYEYCLNPNRFDYHVKFVQNIKGQLDIEKLKVALRLTVHYIEVFNYHLQDKQGLLYWVKNETLNELVWVDNTPHDIDLFLHQAFSLEKGPLYRFGITQKGQNNYQIFLVLHHVLISGRQFPDFSKKVSYFYNKVSEDECSETYLDYQSQKYLEMVNLLEQKQVLSFWKKTIAVDNLINETNFKKSDELSRVNAQYFSLPKEENLCFPQLFLVWGLLLSKYTTNDQFILMYPISISEADYLGNGAWVNSLPFQIQIDENDTFNTLLERYENFKLSLKGSDGLKFSYYPTAKILSAYLNHDLKEGFAETNFCYLNCALSLEKCDVEIDLNLQLSGYGDRLRLEYEENEKDFFIRIVYQENCFTQAWVNNLCDQYQLLLKNCLHSPNEPLSQLSILTPDEYRTVIYDWNNTARNFPLQTLDSLFKDQANNRPDSIALSYMDQHLTYKELDERSNKLARLILKNKPTELICLYLERSLETVISILSVLKAGCAFVPISPKIPIERSQHIISDTKTNLILTQKKLALNFGVAHINVDDMTYLCELNLCPDIQRTSNDLAYVIYTSGTTGLPKGVLLEHRNLINTVYAVSEVFDNLNPGDKLAQICSYTFDTFCLDFSLSWLKGGELVIIPEDEILDPENLLSYFDSLNITYCDIPTALVPFLIREKAPQNLRYLICGGEKLSSFKINHMNHITFVNSYGPTECCVETHLAIHKLFETDHVSGEIIGHNIFNIQSYILNKYLKPVPTGAVGELYIGGAGIARGYLNRPELTEQRFINNPFGNGKMYKTGDLVKYLEDGNIEFIGRNDFQVKIRGFRVELGEIETILNSHHDILQASVQYYTEPKTMLVAYYVSQIKLDEKELQQYLAKHLPDFMIPNVYVYLDAIPLTINGKLDIKALPKPQLSVDEYIAPRNELEQSIVDIWQEILKVERVGITDDFFSLGGDSILAIRIVSKIKKLGYKILIKDIYNKRKIVDLVEEIEPYENQHHQEIDLTGEFNLLPIQHWFFNRSFKNPHHWNYTFMVNVPSLDLKQLNIALLKLVEHHDALRLRFKNRKQYYASFIPNPIIERYHFNDIDFTSLQSDFNLESGPTWRVAYIDGYPDGTHRLFCAFHHLIMDPMSMCIFTEDLKKLYDGQELDKKTATLKEWVNQLPKDEYDWSKQITPSENFEMMDRPIQESIIFDEQTTINLIKHSSKAYNTQINDLLLSALVLAIHDCLNQDVFSIAHEGHGREEINDLDVSRTIGWFSTTYPVKLEYKEPLEELILNVKNNLRSIPNKGISFCESFENRLPMLTFNYVGQFDTISDWRINLNEYSGNSIANENNDIEKITYILDMNGAIINDCLEFSVISYLKNMQNFSQKYQNALISIIEHCNSKIIKYFLE